MSKTTNFNDKLNNFTIVSFHIFKMVLIVNSNSSCLSNKEPKIKTQAQIKYIQKMILMMNVNISLKQCNQKNLFSRFLCLDLSMSQIPLSFF